MPLDYNKSIPLHIQLKNEIESRIEAGVYKGKIPSELDLKEEYHVSRSTVREAINLLVKEGILEKRHGRGTFVSLKSIHDWLGNLRSTSETIQLMGMKPGAKLLSSEPVTLSRELVAQTGIEKAFLIKRLRYADKIPIGIERNYYSLKLGEKLAKYDLNQVTLYDVLEHELSIRIHEADQVIKSSSVSSEDARYLHVPKNTSMLIAERKILDVDNNFIEFEHASYRSDMYSFRIKMSRKF